MGDDGEPYPRSVARARCSLAGGPGGRSNGHLHPGHGDHGGPVAGRCSPRAAVFRGAGGALASGGRLVPAGLVDRVLEWLSGRSLLTFSLDGQTVDMNRLVSRLIRTGWPAQAVDGSI